METHGGWFKATQWSTYPHPNDPRCSADLEVRKNIKRVRMCSMTEQTYKDGAEQVVHCLTPLLLLWAVPCKEFLSPLHNVDKEQHTSTHIDRA